MPSSKKQGFSIIEMLVSISIIVIISSVLIVNFRDGEKKSRLNLSADVLVSNIRSVQNMVLNGSKFADHEMPYNGYGIYFENSRYLIFADDNSNMVYDAGEELNVFNFSDISFAVSSDEGNDLNNLLFKPPKAQICANADLCALCDCNLKNSGIYSIILTQNITGDSVNITLNQISGRVNKE
ncbi:MAG: prepilin-type N-terminal cleavage/methylation domain-containing protein [bacterium]